MNTTNYQTLVAKHREKIFEVERYIWQHPETGFREWNTSRYLADIFEAAGYTLTRAGNIPGFYTDIDTGRPGPRVLILGEMDALLAPNHPDAVNGLAHACGHHAQCAALVGVALALKEPGALDGLCGSIRLMAVPAEELIELEYRDTLRQQGIIHYLGGKVEFMYRGYMDGCDFALMNHATVAKDHTYNINHSNGCMLKEITYTGVSAHAGGSPHLGINAMYAATQGLSAINALRETFRDDEHIRVHPILSADSGAVNIIPNRAQLSTYVRGASIQSMKEANHKVNRALASGALALGAGITVSDRPGYMPLLNDAGLMEVAREVAVELFGAEQVRIPRSWGCGSTDMGDVSCVIRAIHGHIAGASGKGHGDNYRVTDPETLCVLNAVVDLRITAKLLENNAARGRQVLAGPPLRYASMQEYFADVDQFLSDRELVHYDGNTAVVEF